MIGEMTNHLWQSTLFVVVPGFLAIAFRENRAKIRYGLWLSASLKFLVPFSLLISLGNHIGWTSAVNDVFTRPVSLTVAQIAKPFPNTLSLVGSTPHQTDWVLIVILGMWACGCVAIVLMRLRSWFRVRAAIKSSTLYEAPLAVEVRTSPGLLEPGVAGLFRPVLLLPEGIEQRLTPPQMRAVLDHESCHVRRRDNLTAAIHMIVEALFWFHPLVWLIGRELVKERERACDEVVLGLGTEARVYAEGILAVCKSYMESPLSCVAGVTGPDINKRVELIMKNYVGAPLNFKRKVFLTIAAAAVLAAPIVFGVLGATPGRAASHDENESVGVHSYDLISIRSDKAGTEIVKTGKGALIQKIVFRNEEFIGMGVTLKVLIKQAYGVQDFQISDGPAWLNTEVYDVDAKAGKARLDRMQKLSNDQRGLESQQMLQSLLADHFKLQVHHQTQESSVSALVIAANGPKLHEATPGDTYPNGIKMPDGRPVGAGQMERTGQGLIVGQDIPVGELARLLTQQLGRTIEDKTGLQGNYDLKLEWAPENNAEAQPSASRPSISTALQEQLGLSLESQKDSVDILVIDHAEQPVTPISIQSQGEYKDSDRPVFKIGTINATNLKETNQERLISAIEIHGDRRVSAETIRALIHCRPGDTYNEGLLERDFDALWNTHYFDDLRFDRELTAKGWTLHVYVTERSTDSENLTSSATERVAHPIEISLDQRSIIDSKEKALKQDLFVLRALISHYALAQQGLPQALHDLVSAGFMREIPNDPMTGKPNWHLEREHGTLLLVERKPGGIDDVHSSSIQLGSDGTPYSSW